MAPSDFSILIVDDEEDLLELIVDSFELEDFNITAASNGEKAFAAIDEKSFHVILCDQNLPGGITGDDILAKVKEDEKQKDAKFFLLTGEIDIDVNDLTSRGAEGVIEKPFDSDEVLEKIKTLLGI